MRRSMVLLIAAMLARAAAPQGQRNVPPLAELLRGTATYAERFEREFTFIVAEERYVQQPRATVGARRGERRTLVSDVFLMWVSEGTLRMTARNVRAVDDMVVTDSALRLERLLASAAADSAVKQRLLRDETARFNVGSIIRNFSDPTLVVQFLHQRLQSRFSFRVAARETVAGVPTWKLTYMERERPTLIAINDRDAMASGDVWIAASDHAVVRARLQLTEVVRPLNPSTSKWLEARLETTYAQDAKLDLWVPRTMAERYEVWAQHFGGTEIEEGVSSTASYSNFRRFETSGRVVN